MMMAYNIWLHGKADHLIHYSLSSPRLYGDRDCTGRGHQEMAVMQPLVEDWAGKARGNGPDFSLSLSKQIFPNSEAHLPVVESAVRKEMLNVLLA